MIEASIDSAANVWSSELADELANELSDELADELDLLPALESARGAI